MQYISSISRGPADRERRATVVVLSLSWGTVEGPNRRNRGATGSGLALRYLVAELLTDPGDDLGGGRARGEDPGHAHPGQLRDVLVRDDAAAEHYDVGGVPLLEQFDDPGEERHVRAGEDREPDRVHVFLDGGRDDLLRGLVQSGIDDLHAGVTQRAGHHLGSPVVAVEPGLRDDYPDLAHDGKPNRACRSSAGPASAGPAPVHTAPGQPVADKPP